MYDAHLERLASWATSPRFEAEVAAARETFFAGTGVVHEDDRSFEARMSALSEYYLLDRPLAADGAGRTPARLFLDESGDALEPEARTALEGLTRTHSGLFEIRKLKDGLVLVQDVFEGGRHEVRERRRLAGLEKGDLVQTRLVPFEDGVLFGRAFVFHPRPARRLILKAVKRRRKAGELEDLAARQALLWRLAHWPWPTSGSRRTTRRAAGRAHLRRDQGAQRATGRVGHAGLPR